MTDALRLAFGTLTVLPVRPPARVDRRTAGWAMALSPLVGLVLGLLVLGAVAALRASGDGSLLPAVLVVVLAGLTRGCTSTGSADTADGLGSGRPAAQALAVMRRGDLGPFGAVTLVLTLLLQVAAVERLLSSPAGPVAVAGAVVLAAALPWLCRRGVPAARPDGLGHLVAGSVSPALLAGAAVLTAGCLAVLGGLLVLAGPAPQPSAAGTVRALLVLVLPLLAADLLARHRRRRLGGLTGDVLGAGVEVTWTLALLLAAL